PAPARPTAATAPPDLPALCEAMAAVRTFLERPAAAPPASAIEEVFSLADLEQFETCPRRYFFTRQHLAPLVVREPSVAATVGNLVHQALRIFHGYQAAGSSGSSAGAREAASSRRHPRLPGGRPDLPPVGSRGPSSEESRGGVSTPDRPLTGMATPGSPPGGPAAAPVEPGGEGQSPRGRESPFSARRERPSLEAILDRLVPLHGPAGLAARPRAAAILERYAASPLAEGPVWLLEAEVNVRLVGPSGPFLVRGFTDRVDRDGPNTRLIDYKTHPYSPAAHAGYVRQMALYLAAARHGILGDRGALNFPEVCLAYLTERGVEIHPAEPDTVAFEAWATAVVEAIRRETAWQAGSEAPCPDCGFLVLCGRPPVASSDGGSP
ncbi:MAG: PD-(D/E)XK nuclease family protein, partial [Candidatus Riflebacteria bacterium]|nr:PD-(D/E)XK nuclease family protein [Candidatus Riflebacteria bacterium]